MYCLSVSTLAYKRKWLELSTANLVNIYSTAVAKHALTKRSKDQRSRSHSYESCHGHMAASEMCCCGRVLLQPTWGHMSYDCFSA